jgi:hypothetical protein
MKIEHQRLSIFTSTRTTRGRASRDMLSCAYFGQNGCPLIVFLLFAVLQTNRYNPSCRSCPAAH